MATYNFNTRPSTLTLEDEVVICETKHTIKIAKGYYLDAGGSRLNDYAYQTSALTLGK